ncbi:MAG TPA: L,D-transpeptidase family protein [Acidobacteriaceae bacterium]
MITSRTTALPRTRLFRAMLVLPVFASLLLPIGGCRSSKNLIARLHPRRSKTRPNTTEYADTVAKVVSTPHLDILRWANFADYQPQVQQFYDGRNYELAWTRDGVPTPQASALIREFTGAANKGLRPEDYDAQRWPELLQKLASIQMRHDTSEDAQNTIAQFDAAVTIATMRYVSDLHLGRINPQALNFDIDVPAKRAAFDLPGFVDDQLVDANDVPGAIAGIEPQNPMYLATEQALPKYLQLAEQEEALFRDPLPPVEKAIAPGGSYIAVDQLTQRLAFEAFLLADNQPQQPDRHGSSIYTPELSDAVKAYQRQHGLTADGKLTASTIASLNVPMSARVQQIDDALEHWRWLPDNYVQPRLLVNLPEFLVRAYDSDHNLAFKMRIVDGEAKGNHDTPVFVRTMKYMIFRPYWNLPVSIVKKELLRHVNSGGQAYLDRNNYEVINNKGELVTGWSVNDLEHSRYLVRQKPGPRNSLGLVKFMFPNEYDIYMHSTPEMSLFNLTRRDRSHGCVRLHDAEKMANWVLDGQGNWDADKIHAAMFGPTDGGQAGNNKQVNLQTQLPVVITYLTAIADEDGTVHFFDDIYGYDKELEAALAQPRPYPRDPVKINPKLTPGETE